MFNLPQKINQLVFTPFCWLTQTTTYTQSSSIPALEKQRPLGPSSLVFRSRGFWGAYGQKHSVQLHLQEMGIYVSEFKIKNNSS